MVSGVAFLSKGRVLVYNNGTKMVVSAGAFLGIPDLYTGRYQSTYIAIDDVLIYIFSINQPEDLEQVMSLHKDYPGAMVASNNMLIFGLDQNYHKIRTYLSELYQFIRKNYKEYVTQATHKGYQARTNENIRKLHVPDHTQELFEDRISYYRECTEIPIDIVKAFYSYSTVVTLYQLEEQASIINHQMESLKTMAEELVSMAGCLIDKTDNGLFYMVGELGIKIEKDGGDGNLLIDIIDRIIDAINKAENMVDHSLGIRYIVDRNSMEEIYNLLLVNAKANNKTVKENESEESDENTPQELVNLRDSFGTILEYAQIRGEQAESMKDTMLAFVNLKNRQDTDDSTRVLRKQLSKNHYELYKTVFLRAYHDKAVPKVIELFLKYGYADERLLSEEQLISLYHFEEKQDVLQEEEPCQVYNIKEWLTLIYEGKRNPSKNEFDQDYSEMLYSMKKQAKLSEAEAVKWGKDPERKLEYEIQNLFRYNNRTTNGQISVFVPILHQDMVSNDFGKLYVSKKEVNDIIQKLMRIDYSVFDREVLYMNEEKNIVKEYIVKRVYPDIICMPTVGDNGVMWQEISGRRKDTSGRFLLPIFSEVSLSAIMVQVFGRFRWELCRSIEGIAWNDIKHKSLTSEYSDYLQFYRKNKDLSEDKKEKLKNQIQKGRNNSREIFVMDYEQWINYESRGAIKLNKQVREMMATYCPFSREIREQIKAQPLFAEAMNRYYRKKQKKIRETESRYRNLEREQIKLTKELTDTLEYYKEQ
jgi:hypothetical protein